MFVNPSQIEGCTATSDEETSLGACMLLTGDLVCKKTCFRLPISTYTEQTGRCFGESISYFAVLSGYKSTHYLVFCVPKKMPTYISYNDLQCHQKKNHDLGEAHVGAGIIPF